MLMQKKATTAPEHALGETFEHAAVVGVESIVPIRSGGSMIVGGYCRAT
jgi:hypothetical protein